MEKRYTLRQLIKSDIAAWADLWVGDKSKGHYGFGTGMRLLWTYAGLRATVLYRISQVLYRKRVKVLPQMLWRLNIFLHGLDIPPGVPIGPRLYIPHPVGTVVTAKRIGSGCTLVSGITIGMRNEPKFPRLGDNVYVGAGARILGEIKVGNNVQVGANAVVVKDVPDNHVAVGVPATFRPAKPLSDQQTAKNGASDEEPTPTDPLETTNSRLMTHDS